MSGADTTAAARKGQERVPELPASLIKTGAIPILGEVDPSGTIRWFDERWKLTPLKEGAGPQPEDPSPEEIARACRVIRRAGRKATLSRKAVTHVA